MIEYDKGVQIAKVLIVTNTKIFLISLVHYQNAVTQTQFTKIKITITD